MYFLALFLGYSIAYPLITLWFRLFFHGIKKPISFAFWHGILIFTWIIGVLLIVQSIPDPAFANRFQHAMGGGFAVIMITYFAYRASGVDSTWFQFFCLSFFIASYFGIVNELFESIIQVQLGYIFSDSREDTWYDLWSNTIGALLGSCIFTSFVKPKKSNTI